MDDELVRTLLDFKLRLSGGGWATLSLLLGNAVREIKRLDSDNQRLAAEVERLTPTWSKERPRVEGQYWARIIGQEDEPSIITKSCVDGMPDSWVATQEFAGPIGQPRAKKEADRA